MSSTAPAVSLARKPAHGVPARVDIVVPVHDEQAALARSIRWLHDHLTDHMPFDWRIVIADNASTDQTPRIAAALAADLPGVDALLLGEKGRAAPSARSSRLLQQPAASCSPP
jgi:glycosyltransferase involved in cell wall biosynthesis